MPGIDDGSPDVETSVALIEGMQEMGIERIFASPHVTDQVFPNTKETADKALDELQAELSRRGNSIILGHSAENRIDDLFMQNFKDGTLMVLRATDSL